jgi:lysophospholipase L1-like esterase
MGKDLTEMNQDTHKSWTAVWGNAVSISENQPESYGKNLTLRYPIYCPFGGEKARVTFDNYCGTDDVILSRATVFAHGKCYPASFEEREMVKIPAGKRVTSDELVIPVNAGDTLLVSFYFADFTQLRSSVVTLGPLSEGLYAVGDQTLQEEIPIAISRKINTVYFLSNVSLYTDSGNRAIVCYGDSITAQAWPDDLTIRLREEGVSNTSIIRRATSGSRILREYDCITYESYGLKGTRRFLHEVPTDGADTVIIQQGINDIIHPVGTDINPFRPMSDLPTAQELIDGLKWYIEQARQLQYRVYVGTLLPIEGWRTYAPFREELKEAYNAFIRTTDLIDGCIDFDAALRSQEHPVAFAAGYDSGDHLHPSLAGYRAMADTVWTSLFGGTV